MLGYSLLAEGGCRLANGSHGVVGVHFILSPANSAGSLQACQSYCTGSQTCLAFEWDRGPPKCESWLVMPAYGEIKPMHTCMLKLRALPPPPPSLPPPLPSDHSLAIGLGVGGGCAALAVVLLLVAYTWRKPSGKKYDDTQAPEAQA